MVWALYAGLTIGDYTLLLYPRTGQSEMISSALSTALLYGTTSFFEMLLLLLLVTNDIGRNTLQTAWRFAAAWGVAVLVAISAVILYVMEQQRSGSPTAAPKYALAEDYYTSPAASAADWAAAVLRADAAAPDARACNAAEASARVAADSALAAARRRSSALGRTTATTMTTAGGRARRTT